MHTPNFTLYVIGKDKEDAWKNCNMPWDDADGASSQIDDLCEDGKDLKVFAMSVFGPADPEELEEV